MAGAGAAAFLAAFIAFIAFTALGMVKEKELAKCLRPQTLETMFETQAIDTGRNFQWSLRDIQAF